MGKRSRKRNIFPDATARSLRKKLPANATMEDIEKYHEKWRMYNRLRKESRRASFQRLKQLEDPSHSPRVRRTYNGTRPKGWTTVWYSGNDRKK